MSRDAVVEARILCRYLVGADPAPAVEARYREACARLFAAQDPPREAAVLAFAVRHKWSLPFLDAASGLIDKQSALRRRLMLMLALLETVPDHAGHFLARPRARAPLILMLLAWGCLSAMKMAVGIALLPLARRRA